MTLGNLSFKNELLLVNSMVLHTVYFSFLFLLSRNDHIYTVNKESMYKKLNMHP